MNSEFDAKSNRSPGTEPDSMEEPRTIPRHWDVSAFTSPGIPGRNGYNAQPVESAEQPESGDSEGDNSHWNPDPFPQPRTIPGKWYTSDLK